MNIKKIFLILCVAFYSLPVLALDNFTCEEMKICPSSVKVNGPVSSFFSKVTGVNFLLTSVLESQLKKQMDRELDANFKVDILPYGGKSLLNGKFKKFKAQASSANIDGFYVSNVYAETLCPYNHFVYEDGNIYTAEDFLMGFSADITTNDLQKLLDSPEYQKILNSMNVSVSGVNVLRVYNPRAVIKDNRLTFSVSVISPLTLGKSKRFSTTMTMVVSDGRILFTDLQTVPKIANTKFEALLPLINNLNPFTIKAAILDNKESSVKIKNIDFVGDKIVVKGLVIVPKNYYNN